LSSLEEELIKAKFRIDTIILARDGKESEDGKLEGGILSYLDNKSKTLKFDEQILELNQIVKWFEEQERISNESRVNEENLKNQQSKLQRALNIEKQFETFLNIQKEIANLQKNIADYKEILLTTEHEKFDIEKEKNDIAIKLNELKNSLEINQSKLNNLPAQHKQLELTSKTIVDSRKIIDDLSKIITAEEKKLNDLKVILDEFEYYENKINDDVELLLEFKLFDEHKKLVTQYVSGQVKLEQLKGNIQEKQFKIDNQHQFNIELNDFINTGLELVNKSKSSECPLCNQSYNSFEILSENILSNKLLDRQLKILLEEKIDLESKMNDQALKLSTDKEKIEKCFSAIKQPYLLSHRNIKNAIDKFDFEKTANLEKLNSSQSVWNDINVLLGDSNTFNELSTKFQNDQSQLDDQILKLSDRIKKLDETLLLNEVLATSTKEKLDLSEPNLLQYQSSTEYTEIRMYFFEEWNSNEVEKVILFKGITNIQEKISDLTAKKERIVKALDELKEKLSNYTLSKNEYVKRTQQANDAKNLIQRVHDSYENFINSEFGIIISNKDKFQIEKAFIDLIETQKELERQVESKIRKYKIVKILNNACIKVAESKKVEDRIKEIAKTLKDLGNSEKILNAEKESLKTFLKSTIESYFYTPLINAIYKKIDPHPDYRSIEFECDFAENKPRLQIYTLSINSKGEEVWSVPSLYFSTAQINILSLSIFLARALKTRDNQKNPVDCIFIDDPIQSMDSINILSFIDLFRGITLSLDKQLIVSTHEENFHLLLKKKIPSELFKSKFLEFETFGKVKSN
jgi:exonuclease SbcC